MILPYYNKQKSSYQKVYFKMHSIAIAYPGEAFARDMLFTIAS